MRFPRCGHKANLPVLLLGYCPDCTSPCFNMELVADASWALALKITPFDHWNMQKRMLKYLPSSFKLVAQLGWEGRMDWWCFSWEPCRPHEDECFDMFQICFNMFWGNSPCCIQWLCSSMLQPGNYRTQISCNSPDRDALDRQIEDFGRQCVDESTES